MEKQKTRIQIETFGGYEFEKIFKKVVEMDERKFLDLCTTILDFLETEKITDFVPVKKVAPQTD